MGTIGTGDPNLGVGYMGPGTQLGAAGTQIHIFDFSGAKKVLYASWGVPGGWGHLAPTKIGA